MRGPGWEAPGRRAGVRLRSDTGTWEPGGAVCKDQGKNEKGINTSHINDGKYPLPARGRVVVDSSKIKQQAIGAACRHHNSDARVKLFQCSQWTAPLA